MDKDTGDFIERDGKLYFIPKSRFEAFRASAVAKDLGPSLLVTLVGWLLILGVSLAAILCPHLLLLVSLIVIFTALIRKAL